MIKSPDIPVRFQHSKTAKIPNCSIFVCGYSGYFPERIAPPTFIIASCIPVLHMAAWQHVIILQITHLLWVPSTTQTSTWYIHVLAVLSLEAHLNGLACILVWSFRNICVWWGHHHGNAFLVNCKLISMDKL